MDDDEVQKVARHSYRRLGVPKSRTEIVVSQASADFFDLLGRDELVLWATTAGPRFHVVADLEAEFVGISCSCGEDETGICDHGLALVKLAATDVGAIPQEPMPRHHLDAARYDPTWE